MAVQTGRPPHKNRPQIIRDLFKIELDVPDIALKNNASLRTIYHIAAEIGMDMVIRRRVLRTKDDIERAEAELIMLRQALQEDLNEWRKS